MAEVWSSDLWRTHKRLKNPSCSALLRTDCSVLRNRVLVCTSPLARHNRLASTILWREGGLRDGGAPGPIEMALLHEQTSPRASGATAIVATPGLAYSPRDSPRRRRGRFCRRIACSDAHTEHGRIRSRAPMTPTHGVFVFHFSP